MNIDAWLWWLIGAVGLGIPLVLTAMPEFGMFAVGAVAAAVTAAFGGGIVAQVLVFVIVSVALVAVVRSIANHHREQRPQHRTGIDALKGRSALVLERVDGSGGRIKLDRRDLVRAHPRRGQQLRTGPAGGRRGDRRSHRGRDVSL